MDNSGVPPIAFVTCSNMPEPDPDEQLLLTACKETGIPAELAAWDDPEVDWSRFGCAILRSTWNYHLAPAAFCQWLGRASEVTDIHNEPGLVRWNMDKRYLEELAGKGVSIVPTRFLAGSDQVEGSMKTSGWELVVLKPTISGGSYRTRSFRGDDIEAAREFAEVFEGGDFMLQQFMSSVVDGGEISLIYIDGKLTHRIVKRPRFEGHDESVSEAFQPFPDQIEAGEKVLTQVDRPWLYARVDLMKDGGGAWLLSELELIEPSLFFLQHPPALSRFLDAINRLPRRCPTSAPRSDSAPATSPRY